MAHNVELMSIDGPSGISVGTDPAAFNTIAAILVGTGIVACLVPATRATRIDPLVALRHDQSPGNLMRCRAPGARRRERLV